MIQVIEQINEWSTVLCNVSHLQHGNDDQCNIVKWIKSGKALDPKFTATNAPVRYGIPVEPEEDKAREEKEVFNPQQAFFIKNSKYRVKGLIRSVKGFRQGASDIGEVLPVPEHHRQGCDTS